MAAKPTAIIDIGSNSVRLVVYLGGRRVPAPIFSEKVLAGLGAGLAETGAISSSAREKALRALRRFRIIVDHIGASRTHVLATAAVRDASNGAEFVREIRSLGLPCRVVSPEEEATLAGLGVLSAIPWAEGIVGDLGGGSLELVEVAGGSAEKPVSLPLGVLRAGTNRKNAAQLIRRAVRDAGWDLAGRRDFYMVGGSWRALARIDMIARDYPLPIFQEYILSARRSQDVDELVGADLSQWRGRIAPARLASAPAAAMLLSILAEELKPRRIVLSTYGIREGLLYSTLSPNQRRPDPLVTAARELSHAETTTQAHGDALGEWLAGGFDDAPELARLRQAACLLADVAWRALPAFRAERAIELALHGSWVGIDPPGRILMAQALASAFGEDQLDDDLLRLCDSRDVERARAWGLGIRTAQRLSGGVASVLDRTRLINAGNGLHLKVPAGEADLVNDAVLKRLTRLADALGLRAVVEPA